MTAPIIDTLVDPAMKDIGPATPRNPERGEHPALPGDAVIVSADGHWEIVEDIFYENFPAHLRDEAPRVWFEKEYWHIGTPGQGVALGNGDRMDRVLQRSVPPGVWDIARREHDLTVEGVEKEVVFPQSLLAFVRYPNFEVQENLYSIYNQYTSARERTATPGRFHSVGVFRNWWDPARAEAAMREIVDLGFKTFMIPMTAGKDANGKTLSWGDPELDRFWDVVAEANLPVNFHVGENPDMEHRGGIGTTVLVNLAPFRKPLGQLIFGGVFDRHPNLKVVFSEGGISWVPPALQDAEMIFDSYGNGDLLDRIEHRPSHYWHNNCYASFQSDRLGLSQLDLVGAERVMWAGDYPHSEGNFGFAWKSREAVIAATTPEKAARILGGTAMELYRLG